MQISTELIVREKVDALAIFTTEGVEPIIGEIAKLARSFQTDVSTSTGRKEVASLAQKVARSKTFLDGLGKELVSDWKKKSKSVDDGRKKMRDQLDELKIEVRQPLTDWELEQNAKREKLEVFLKDMTTTYADVTGKSTKELLDMMGTMDDAVIDSSLGELRPAVEKAKRESMDLLKNTFEERLVYENEQTELAKLRKEAAERQIKERGDKIKKDADARAKKDSEAKVIKLKQQAQDEKDRRILAEKRTKERIAKAKQDERDKIERQKQKYLEAQLKREANLKHRRKINNAAVKAIAKASAISEDNAQSVVEAIAKGMVPNVTISY